MEELIEKCQQKYPELYYIKTYVDGMVVLIADTYHHEDECFAEFDSLDDLRNHLNE